jgi:hypothetical protein
MNALDNLEEFTDPPIMTLKKANDLLNELPFIATWLKRSAVRCWRSPAARGW